MRLLTTALLCSVLVGATTTDGVAQDRPWGFAITGGFSISDVTGDDVTSSSTRTGVLVGAAATYELSPNFALELGANYLAKGATDVQLAGSDSTFTLKSTYFEIPLLLNLILPFSSQFGFGAHAGLSVAFNTSCTERAAGGTRDPVDCGSQAPTLSQVGDAKGTDWTIPVGAGLGLSTGPDGTGAYLVLGVRYYGGLSNAYESRSSGDLNMKNTAFVPYFRVNVPVGG